MYKIIFIYHGINIKFKNVHRTGCVYFLIAIPLALGGIQPGLIQNCLNYRMTVNTQGLKETGKWQQRSRMRIDLCLIVGCGLSRVGGASRVRVDQGWSPGCGCPFAAGGITILKATDGTLWEGDLVGLT